MNFLVRRNKLIAMRRSLAVIGVVSLILWGAIWLLV